MVHQVEGISRARVAIREVRQSEVAGVDLVPVTSRWQALHVIRKHILNLQPEEALFPSPNGTTI
jgi:hypothetical protein